MSTSGQKFDLPQMKSYFEEHIPQVRLLSDLTLSESDFKGLGAKLKSAFAFSDKKDGIEEIMICYLVYWVYALIYWDEESGIHDELTDYCAELPQYQIRHHFEMLVDMFADYNIAKFGYQNDNIEELALVLIARHAGIPNDEKYQVFELIDDYRNQNVSVDTMINDIYAHLPYKSRYIFSMLDERSRQDVIWEIRSLMAEVCSGVSTREDLLDKYPETSVSLIDYCMFWQEGKALLNQAK
ncbi:MAG: hypothetical protein IJ232_02265 [Lachnospiraceae bacterium]|nr:hypothetical protein [Lachnospiraceae bacterium]